MYDRNQATDLRPFHPHAPFRLVAVQVVCLCAGGLIALGALLSSILNLTSRGATAEWVGITWNPLMAAVGCGASLAFCIGRPTKGQILASRFLACSAAVPAFVDLVLRFRGAGFHVALTAANELPIHAGGMPPVAGVSFVLLASLLCIIRIDKGVLSYAADCIVFALALLVLSLIFGWYFAVTRVFGTTPVDRAPAAVLWILALLLVVAFSLRAQYGAFHVFVDHGLGSRIARMLTPIVLILPLLRETARARVIRLHLVQEGAEAAILSSITAVVALALVLAISRHIRRMEEEIQGLTLRDELTGLYNLRGFRLLAEQALRLARRSQMPFSVLFVDVDGLKQINDSLGHAAGSALLVETAELLTASFRESDVVARLGGDEFAVAGQFSRAGIETAAQRLEDQASATRLAAAGGKRLSLSVGFATNGEHRRQSLQDLLDAADADMYDSKGRKKLQVG
ncbi:GGDEF domain-containing protein [Acidobacteria bacterium AB60]|nr:GGDEF domain-containing protein [Acidobacteria bacterium AB60]